MRKVLNRAYNSVLQYTPVSVANSYYRIRTASQPQKWIDFPFFFIHVPKSAGTSICSALRMPDSGHLIFSEMKVKVREKLATKPCIMVVRDPIDRLISTYFYAHQLRRRGQRNSIDWVANFESPEKFLHTVAMKPNIRDHYFIRPAHVFFDSAIFYGANVSVFHFDSINQIAVIYFKEWGINVSGLPNKNSSKEPGLKIPGISNEILNSIIDAYAGDYILIERAERAS